MFSSLEVIRPRRVEQKDSQHDEQCRLQAKPFQLPKTKACKYHSHQAIENSVAHVPRSHPFGLEQVARRELFQFVDFIFMAMLARQHIVHNGGAV